jgi:hypothetical protein
MFVAIASTVSGLADFASKKKQNIRKLVKYLFVVACLYIVLEASRKMLQLMEIHPYEFIASGAKTLGIGTQLLNIVLGSIGLLTVIAITSWSRTSASIFVSAGMVFSPLTLVLFWGAVNEVNLQKTTSEILHTQRNTGQPKIVILIFDELDYQLAYERRPADISLPRLDELTRTSTFFENAYPPSNSTLKSMASIVYGRMVRDAKIVGNTLQVRFSIPDVREIASDGNIFDQMTRESSEYLGARLVEYNSEKRQLSYQSYTEFSQGDELFNDAIRSGRRILVAGWHHPYCRLFRNIDKCWQIEELPYESFTEWLKYVNDTQPTCILLKYCFVGSRLVHHVDAASRVINNLEPELKNHDFFFLHLPTPHMPCRSRRVLPADSKDECTYLDNLLAVEEVVGRMLDMLRKNGLHESTWVIVGSDHYYRLKDAEEMTHARMSEFGALERSLGASTIGSVMFSMPRDYRVPFMIRSPAQVIGVRVKAPTNLVNIRAIVSGIYDKRVRDPETLVELMKRNPFHAPILNESARLD